MNKQQLASKIWESANKMRSKIEANEYKDYILGFIFYKFLSEKEEKYLDKIGVPETARKDFLREDNSYVQTVQDNIGYFISYDNLFSTWIKMKNDFDISNVRDALSAFGRLINSNHKKVFDGIFTTLETGLSKLGETTKAQTKASRDLIDLIKDIPMNENQDYDVLGFIYEYLISNFAANAGKKAGEFYTPHEVSLLMSEIVANHLKDRENIEIYDPTSGSGSLLINIGKSASKYIKGENKIKYFAQELKQNTYNLTRMNLIMRGILPENVVTRNGDTLAEDWPFFDENHAYNPLFVDAVVSNPPYSQNWEPTDMDVDPRYKEYGLAPKGKADYAFLLHDLYHLKSDGIMTIVLPHGVLFRGGEEREIRKNLIEKNNIDTIIGLPANIFFGTGIPTIIMVLKKNKNNTDIQIIDASKGFVKEGKNNKLRACDIKKIVDTVVNRVDIDKYSRVVSRDEIRENDYNLNIPRYVDSSEDAETWDIYASMFGGIPRSEIDKLSTYWETLPNLKTNLFAPLSSEYYEVSMKNIKQDIFNEIDIKTFFENYDSNFSDFESYLSKELIDNMKDINISGAEAIISENIFKRLEKNKLIDKYKAYQLLNDEWKKISVDLEIIQTEGITSITKVDPNMVIKKKDGKDQEVQEGWVGHIIPFEIAQEKFMKDRIEAVKESENRLLEIQSEYEEILESLSEDEKSDINDLLNENNDAFVPKEVTKKAKEYEKTKQKYSEDMLEFKVIKVNKLIEEEKNIKKVVKNEIATIHNETKEMIENLSETEAISLLKDKWITPLVSNISKLPNEMINDLVSKVQLLSEKYSVTYVDIENQIEESEKSLALMIDELVGNEFDMKGLSELQSLLNGG